MQMLTSDLVVDMIKFCCSSSMVNFLSPLSFFMPMEENTDV